MNFFFVQTNVLKALYNNKNFCQFIVYMARIIYEIIFVQIQSLSRFISGAIELLGHFLISQ